VRCNEPKTGKANGKPSSSGIASETMQEIKQTEVSGQPPRESKAAAKVAAKKAAEEKSDEQIQKQRELAAEFLVEGKQDLQEIIARTFYGYEGDAFQLTQDETYKHCLVWAKVAKALNWELDATWMAIGAVIFLESKTTIRQWRQMSAEMESAASREKSESRQHVQ